MRDSRRCAQSSSQGAREGSRQAIELLAELADRLSEFHVCLSPTFVESFTSSFLRLLAIQTASSWVMVQVVFCLMVFATRKGNCFGLRT